MPVSEQQRSGSRLLAGFCQPSGLAGKPAGTARPNLLQLADAQASQLKDKRPKLSDGLGGAGGAHAALANSRDARTDGAEAVRCSALLGVMSQLTSIGRVRRGVS
jgi:hypothetical protein